jgi:hypothetical protein
MTGGAVNNVNGGTLTAGQKKSPHRNFLKFRNQNADAGNSQEGEQSATVVD